MFLDINYDPVIFIRYVNIYCNFIFAIDWQYLFIGWFDYYFISIKL
jgi:hypothetical protein